MIDLMSLLTIAAAFFVIAVSPGPATLSNATLAMAKGRKVSLVYGAGLSSGLLMWGVIAASGLGVILQSSVYVLMLLKVLGGLYLLRLAYQSFKTSGSASTAALIEGNEPTHYRKWFWRGFILNSSNPKTVVAWMAALSVGMGAHTDILSLVAAVTACMFVGFFVNGLYSIVFSVGGVMRVYQKVKHWVERGVAAVFAIAGFSLIKSALSRQ